MSKTIQVLEAEFNQLSYVKIAGEHQTANLENLWKLALDNYFPGSTSTPADSSNVYPVLESKPIDSKSIFEQQFSETLSRLKQDGTLLRTLSPAMKACREVVYHAVKQNGEALQDADAALKQDPAIAYIAVKRSHKALKYVDATLQNDKAFLDATEISSSFYFNVLMSILCSVSAAIAIIGLLMVTSHPATPVLAAVGTCMILSGIISGAGFFSAVDWRQNRKNCYEEGGDSYDRFYTEALGSNQA